MSAVAEAFRWAEAMNACATLLITLLLISCGGQRAAEPAVRLLEQCPVTRAACVPMTISAKHLEQVLERRSPQDANGYTEFWVRAQGRVAGGPTKVNVLLIRGYTDGIECTSFGQSNVAIVGLSPSGQSTLLSESGEFIMAPDALTVGCPDCIAPSNGRSSRRSPSWDLSLTGHRSEQFFETWEGEAAVDVPSGCIVLSDPFALLPATECAARRSPGPLDIRTGACT